MPVSHREFRRDPLMERLIKMKDADPDRYTAQSASMKMQVGYYEIHRAAAKAAGQDIDAEADE